MRRPGWRNERGTQVGLSLSNPPVRESSASTIDFVLVLTVFSWLVVLMLIKGVAKIAALDIAMCRAARCRFYALHDRLVAAWQVSIEVDKLCLQRSRKDYEVRRLSRGQR